MKKKILNLISKIKNKNITIGIVGLGRIGKEVALRMQSFGMKVSYVHESG